MGARRFGHQRDRELPPWRGLRTGHCRWRTYRQYAVSHMGMQFRKAPLPPGRTQYLPVDCVKQQQANRGSNGRDSFPPHSWYQTFETSQGYLSSRLLACADEPENSTMARINAPRCMAAPIDTSARILSCLHSAGPRGTPPAPPSAPAPSPRPSSFAVRAASPQPYRRGWQCSIGPWSNISVGGFGCHIGAGNGWLSSGASRLSRVLLVFGCTASVRTRDFMLGR